MAKTIKIYIFIKDYIFNSPSAASDIILGNSTSGWKKWKIEDGKTLRGKSAIVTQKEERSCVESLSGLKW